MGIAGRGVGRVLSTPDSPIALGRMGLSKEVEVIPLINTGLHTCPREFVKVRQTKLRFIKSEYLASSQETI